MPIVHHNRLLLDSFLTRYTAWDGVTSKTLFNTSSYDMVSSKSGISNPLHVAQIKNHIDATTPFTAGKQEALLYGGRGSAVVKYHTTFGGTFPATETFTGVLPMFVPLNTVDGSLNSKTNDIVRSKLYKLLDQRQTAFQGGVFLGELRETLRMIRNPAKGLSDYILGKQYRRYKRAAHLTRTSKRNARKAVADLWLETQFGWKPFMSDIEKGLIARQQVLKRVEYEPFTVTATAEKTEAMAVATWSHSRLTWSEMEYIKRTTNYKVYGETYIKGNGVLGQLGLAPRNFIPTIWELLPFSFLVDYFVNVGEVLTACSVDIGNIRRASAIRRKVCDTTVVFSSFRPSAFGDIDSVSGGFPPVTLRDKTVERFLGYGISRPSLRIGIPGRASQWYNMGALIQSLYRGNLRF